MLFFRRRDTDHTHLTDQERCIHACLFFAFLALLLTIVFFYFGITYKGPADQRLYYYLGAGICFAILLFLSIGTILYIRRFYMGTCTTNKHQHHITTESDYDSSKYSNTHA